MNNTVQRPQGTPRTTTSPKPSTGSSRGTGPRTPANQR